MSTVRLKPLSCALIIGLPLVLLLPGCGGGGGGDAPDADDPLLPYLTQPLAWTPCASDTYDFDDEAAFLDAQCATLRAPLTYDDPSLGDIELAVLRVPARQPAQRRGALFMNPGGPGGDGMPLAAWFHQVLSGSNPEDSLGAMQLRLLDEYDILGFSPRGTGQSTALECISDETLRPVDYDAANRHAPGNVDNMVANARLRAEACLNNPLTPHIDTENTVRDMDLIRAVLGDERLSYLGYSYGSWLGAWYASRFPARVDRMVLDSNMDFSQVTVEAQFLPQPIARERWLDEIMTPYALRHADHFGLDDEAGPDPLRRIIDSLLPGLRMSLADALAEDSYLSAWADDAVMSIVIARALDAVFRSMPDASITELKAAIDAQTLWPQDPELEQAAHDLAHGLLDGYLEHARPPASPEPLHLPPEEASFYAVLCNELPVPRDPAFWIAKGNEFADKYPIFGTYVTEEPCMFWRDEPTRHPGLDVLRTVDLMMVQSGYDNATPYAGAISTYNALPRAQGVFVLDDFQHGVYPYMDRCVDTAVTAYLLGTSAGARETLCPALPLAQDSRAPSSAAATQNSTMMRNGRPDRAPSAYHDPAAAREELERLKEAIAGPRSLLSPRRPAGS